MLAKTVKPPELDKSIWDDVIDWIHLAQWIGYNLM